MEEWIEIQQLALQGRSVSSIANGTGSSRNTVTKWRRKGSAAPAPRRRRSSTIDPHRGYN